MAERRMFAKTIIDSDAFLDMPLSTQALYFHLSMRADDDGFINNPKKIQRMIGCSDDDLKLLLAKSFIIAFESGIIVIKHWRLHNYIRKDTYNETRYKQEKSQLCLDENKEYQFAVDGACTNRIQAVDELSTQDSLGKDRLVQDRLGESSCFPPSREEVEAFAKAECLGKVNLDKFFDYYNANGWMVGKNPMKDWKAVLRNWNRNEKDNVKQKFTPEGRDLAYLEK